MSDIILEAWESKTVLDNNDFEKTKSGDLVFKVIFDGINEKDAHKIAWGWSKITHLIHENINDKPNSNLYKEFQLGDSYNIYLHDAKDWLNTKSSAPAPIGFASATEGQRIYLNRRPNDISLMLLVHQYEHNKIYYESLLNLLNIDLNSLKSNNNEPINIKLENINVRIYLNNEQKLSKIEIRELH